MLINSWEAAYFDFTGDTIVDLAKEAASLGIDMVVMDDGWFGKRDDDNSSLGDWFVNEKKLGGTLSELILDFSRKEVRDNIFDQICAVFDQGKIDYVKWDMNRSMADVYAGNLAYDYVLGVYDFMERLVTRYPDILLEGCSGGGGPFFQMRKRKKSESRSRPLRSMRCL